MAGAVEAGDSRMARGGAAEGGNQTKMIVMEMISVSGENRKYVVRRKPQLTYCVFLNNYHDPSNPKHNNIQTDMCIKDYDEKKFLGHGKSVKFFGMNPNPIPVIIPVTVNLKNRDEIKGTISVDFCCDVSKPEKLVAMLESDYAEKEAKGYEYRQFMNADNLSKYLRNYIGDCSLSPMTNMESTYDVSEMLRSYLFDSLDRDVGFKSLGLKIRRASARFEASQIEKYLNTTIQDDIEDRRKDRKIKSESGRRILVFELAGKEYDAYNED